MALRSPGEWWSVLSKVEMLELLWHLLEEAVQRLREVGTLARIYDVRPEDIPSSKGVRNALLRGAPATLGSSVEVSSAGQDLVCTGEAAAELSLLITAGREGT